MTGLVYGYPCLVLFPLDFPVQQSFEFFQHSLLSEYQSFVIWQLLCYFIPFTEGNRVEMIDPKLVLAHMHVTQDHT